ncbi:aminoglycoside phosphotransferase family protein [Nocardioides sambongensis]|uniref:aminoglycoside phosphotransferase family protein n=1 Tax=Nocardioides sambongensis TaxID=2589074 RepID=UPI00112D00B1|nr:aminoglycoside phosphotransferase family protein [Nocardioides sambongensis]
MGFEDGLVGFEPLPGGWSGETFLAETASERSVVRIFAAPHHRSEAPEIQAALHQLVRGLVPVPAVKEVRRRRDADAPGLLVTEHLPGVRGDLLLADLDAGDRARVGAVAGEVAATLAGMATLRSGTWADADLRIAPYEISLPGWVEDHAAALARHGWSAADLGALGSLAAEADPLLLAVGRTCVVHSDLNPKNLLFDPSTLRVTGVVDWEYSHSGHPWTDVGNLVRVEGDTAFNEAVLCQWRERHGGDRSTLLSGARAADLVALVELAARAEENPVAEAAAVRLRAAVADPAGYLTG